MKAESEANVYEPLDRQVKQVEVKQEDNTSAEFDNQISFISFICTIGNNYLQKIYNHIVHYLS